MRLPNVPDSLQARRYYVSGMVQGVGFRFFAERLAARLGLAGYVKNLRDGRVEVYAVGLAEKLDALAAELARGPRAAFVSGVAAQDAAVEQRYMRGFSIEHDNW